MSTTQNKGKVLYLRPEQASIAEKLRAGMVLRLHVVRRGGHRSAVRLGFSPTDTVALQSVEPLLAKGIAILRDGAFHYRAS